MQQREIDPWLTIDLQAAEAGRVVYVTDSGEQLLAPFVRPSAELRGDRVWARIAAADSAETRKATLLSAGERLGAVLFREELSGYLSKANIPCVNRRRVEVILPDSLVEWPWELALLDSLVPKRIPISVHPSLVMVRRSRFWSEPRANKAEPPPYQLVIEALGWLPPEESRSEGHVARGALLGDVLNEVSQPIIQAGTRGRVSVNLDLDCDWEQLQWRYRTHGPPHVWHFIGKTAATGQALLFCRGAGHSCAVTAAQLGDSLMSVLHRSAGRQVQLVALTSLQETPHSPWQCFATLGQQLLQEGCRFVACASAPLSKWEHAVLAKAFYGALAAGDSVDLAIHSARESLYDDKRDSLAWAFVSLAVSAQPLPLMVGGDGAAAPPPNILAFGHDDQRGRLMRFLNRPASLVIVIPGECGRGHRHVSDRIQHDLAANGNVLWRPVATIDWFYTGEPLLRRGQLLAALAHALYLRSDGSLEELELRIVQELANRCRTGKVVVLDLQEPITARTQVEAKALVELAQDLFQSLLAQAQQECSTLAVFLILLIGYPRRPAARDRQAAQIREAIEHTRAVVAQLREKKKGSEPAKVEVLADLLPFDGPYIARFLEDVLNLEESRAAAIAENFVGGGADNEMILERLRNLISTWRPQ